VAPGAAHTLRTPLATPLSMTDNVFGGTLNLTQQLSLDIGGLLLLVAYKCRTLSRAELAKTVLRMYLLVGFCGIPGNGN